MNVEIGTEALCVQFPEKEYINGIFFAVCTCWQKARYLELTRRRRCEAHPPPYTRSQNKFPSLDHPADDRTNSPLISISQQSLLRVRLSRFLNNFFSRLIEANILHYTVESLFNLCHTVAVSL
jgi:hypothetical protein